MEDKAKISVFQAKDEPEKYITMGWLRSGRYIYYSWKYSRYQPFPEVVRNMVQHGRSTAVRRTLKLGNVSEIDTWFYILSDFNQSVLSDPPMWFKGYQFYIEIGTDFYALRKDSQGLLPVGHSIY